MLQLTPGGKIKSKSADSLTYPKSGPGDAEGLFECGRKLIDGGSDFARLFGERRHHPFGDRWFVPD